MRNKVVTLSTPIERAGKDVEHIDVREPSSGECRGMKLGDIMTLDVTTLHTLLPRVTNPALTRSEAEALSLHDLTQFGTALLDFFEKPATLAA